MLELKKKKTKREYVKECRVQVIDEEISDELKPMYSLIQETEIWIQKLNCKYPKKFIQEDCINIDEDSYVIYGINIGTITSVLSTIGDYCYNHSINRGSKKDLIYKDIMYNGISYNIPVELLLRVMGIVKSINTLIGSTECPDEEFNSKSYKIVRGGDYNFLDGQEVSMSKLVNAKAIPMLFKLAFVVLGISMFIVPFVSSIISVLIIDIFIIIGLSILIFILAYKEVEREIRNNRK